MTAELAYQSRECEKLAQSNRLLGVEVSRLEGATQCFLFLYFAFTLRRRNLHQN